MRRSGATKQTRHPTIIATLFIGLLFVAFAPDARAYEPIGQVDPNSNGLVWELPPGSQVLSKCCYRDRDCDHVVDWVEAELAWAFRPYVTSKAAMTLAWPSGTP
jgi:hypothetical protein